MCVERKESIVGRAQQLCLCFKEVCHLSEKMIIMVRNNQDNNHFCRLILWSVRSQCEAFRLLQHFPGSKIFRFVGWKKLFLWLSHTAGSNLEPIIILAPFKLGVRWDPLLLASTINIKDHAYLLTQAWSSWVHKCRGLASRSCLCHQDEQLHHGPALRRSARPERLL